MWVLRPISIKNSFIIEAVVVVGARGFEPPTSASRTLRSTRLSHAPQYHRSVFGLSRIRLGFGAEGGSRTHTRLPSTVFETAASAIPPLRLSRLASAQLQDRGHLLQANTSLVGARGFEPPTSATPLQCATRLRYAPSWQAGQESNLQPADLEAAALPN